jgi:hypothetical protein
MIGNVIMEELELKARIVRGKDGSVDFYFAKDFDASIHMEAINKYLDNAKDVEIERIKDSTEKVEKIYKQQNEQLRDYYEKETAQLKLRLESMF